MLRWRLSCSSKWWLGLLAVLLVAGAGCGSDSGGGGSSGGSKAKFNEFLYVTNQGDDVISEFSIDRHNGALSSIGQVTAGIVAGATGIAVTPDFDFVYVTNVNNSEVYGFVINSDGTLAPTEQGEIDVNDGSANPTRVTADTTGAFLYVLDNEGETGQVFAYSIGDGGTLTLITPQIGEVNPIPTGVDPSGIASVNALSGGSLNAIYVTNQGDGTISQYAVNSDGTLSVIGSPVDSLGPNGPGSPTGIVVPGPQDAYVSDQSGGTGGVVSHFTIASDGSLTFSASTGTGNTAEGSFPAWITAALLKEKIFTSNIVELPLTASSSAKALQAATNNLSGFKLKPHSGDDLIQTSLTDFDGFPAGLSSDVIGKFLYVPNGQNGTVSQYLINANKGTLKPIGSGSVDTETPANSESNPLQAASALLPIVSQ